MKKLLSAIACIAILCGFAPWETITGNGNMKKENREVSGYNGISLAGNMNLDIDYGKSSTITIEADENLLPYIETEVKEGILIIKAKDNANLKSKGILIIHASLTQLTDLKLSGSGNIKGKGAFSNEGKTNISLSGSGNINLAAKSFGETSVNISGSGNITLEDGNTETLEAKISGSGNIDCSSFVCNNAIAKISGSGNIKVNANKSIDGAVSGSGNVYYKGNATNLNMKSHGSGKIRKM